MNTRDNEKKQQPSIDEAVFDFVCHTLSKLRRDIQQKMKQTISKESQLDPFLSHVDFSYSFKSNEDCERYVIELSQDVNSKWLEIPTTVDVYISNWGEIEVEKNKVFIQCITKESDIVVPTVLVDGNIKEKGLVKLQLSILNYGALKKLRDTKEAFDLVLQARYIDQYRKCIDLTEKTTLTYAYSRVDQCVAQLDKWFEVKKRFPLAVINKEIRNANYDLEMCMNRLLNIEKMMIYE